jgi:hypothetical protein
MRFQFLLSFDLNPSRWIRGQRIPLERLFLFNRLLPELLERGAESCQKEAKRF